MIDVRPPPPWLFDVVVGGVVGAVAVEEPLAGAAGGPDDVVTLAGADVDGVFGQTCGGRRGMAVGLDDLEARAACGVGAAGGASR